MGHDLRHDHDGKVGGGGVGVGVMERGREVDGLESVKTKFVDLIYQAMPPVFIVTFMAKK